MILRGDNNPDTGGYREQKQYMLGNRLTLRSRLPELVKQELWGILLTYNLVRYQMVKMCHQLKGDYLPYQLSFNGSLAHHEVISRFTLLEP